MKKNISPLNFGERFFKWTVIRYDGIGKSNKHMYLCKCDCGITKSVLRDSLKNGRSKSCGCDTREKFIKRVTTHKMSYSPEYKSYTKMKNRCCDKNSTHYSYYGARGILVCDRWLESFENFYEDMGDKPPGCSIERIDVNGNYEPSNCKWATVEEQSFNKRKTIYLEYDGIKIPLLKWSRLIMIPIKTLTNRCKIGWEPKRILLTPPRKRLMCEHEKMFDKIIMDLKIKT